MTRTREHRAEAVRDPGAPAEAFGLRVELPEDLLSDPLRPAPVGDPRPATVVSVERETIPEWSRAERVREARSDGRIVWSVDADPERGFLMQAHDLATMLVSPDGLSVRCAPSRACTDGGWSTLVPAQALPLAATLRGLEMLHASAVSIDGRALLFCAQQGTGKSSLAAQLVLRGAGLLGDDAVAIDDDRVAHPSTGAVHLRSTELARLDDADRNALGIAKAVRFDGRAVGGVSPAPAAPIEAIYLLEHSTATPAIEALHAVDPKQLLAATFNLSVRTPDRLLRHLDFCAELARLVPVFRLRIGPGVDSSSLAQEVLRCR